MNCRSDPPQNQEAIVINLPALYALSAEFTNLSSASSTLHRRP
jgi:hypothetical protein